MHVYTMLVVHLYAMLVVHLYTKLVVHVYVMVVVHLYVMVVVHVYKFVYKFDVPVQYTPGQADPCEGRRRGRSPSIRGGPWSAAPWWIGLVGPGRVVCAPRLRLRRHVGSRRVSCWVEANVV